MPHPRSSLVLTIVLAALTSVAAARPKVAAMTPVPLPSGTIGAGFDDLGYDPATDRVLVPAGRTGKLFLLNPATQAMDAVEGFGTEPFPGGHGGGSTSADAGAGVIFAIDRSTRTLNVVDPAARRIVFTTTLAGGPDIVRYVPSRNEVWVTEPHDQRIEVFTYTGTGAARLAHAADIAVPEDAPEALAVDATRNRMYTNQESGTTWAIDLTTRQPVASWPLGCGPSGLALDETRGWLFVACEEEGRITVLDLANGGKVLDRIDAGKGIDLFCYSPALRHLYVPGAGAKTLSIVGVSAKGKLTLLGQTATAEHAHSDATDGRGHVYVSDPTHGRLLYVQDPFPATTR